MTQFNQVQDNKEALMEALQDGPVSIAIEATSDLQQFSGNGIFKDSNPQCGATIDQLNHGTFIL